jgi:hypothetical protein
VIIGAAIGAAASCDDEQAEHEKAASFCESMDGYVSSCDELNACEKAVVRDCDPLRTVLASAFVDATADCMNALGSPQSCLADAVELTPSSGALEAFAQQLCLECGDGAGACEDEVLGGDGDGPLARAGRLARVLDRGVLEDVADECATGEGCAESFEACAEQVLSREVPDDSASCLIDAVQERYDDDCDASASTTGDPSDPSGDPSDPSGDSSDPSGDPSDPTGDPTDPTGDPEECRDEGCACQFNEDCTGSLLCVDDVCTGAPECADDEWEPNNGEIQAAFLPPINDEDVNGSYVQGELEAPTDEDWFRFEGLDSAWGIVNPYAQVNVTSLTLCIYAECTSGLANTSVECPMGSTQQPSLGGLPGCCAQGAAGIDMTLSCNAGFLGSDDAYIYMSVTGSEPGVCQEFTLTYHY